MKYWITQLAPIIGGIMVSSAIILVDRSASYPVMLIGGLLGYIALEIHVMIIMMGENTK